MNSLPKISVVTITYGHQDYITETLDGVFMQQYEGPIEFIIANDNSPDNTDQVIKDYLATHKIPENFEVKYTKHPQNIGMIPNFIWALTQATGKYIALCEGDDYWTDPLKIKQQVEFLEHKDDYVLCFTNRDVLQNGEMKINKPLYERFSFEKSDVSNVYIPPLTVFFRNYMPMIPLKLHRNLIDCSLFLFLSQFGKYYYMDKSTGVYRIHDQGAYSGSSDLVNKSRSVRARIAAWFCLDKIDKLSLALTIKYLINQKKEVEKREKKYLLLFSSIIWGFFFDFYILQKILKRKCLIKASFYYRSYYKKI